MKNAESCENRQGGADGCSALFVALSYGGSTEQVIENQQGNNQ